MTGTEGQRRAQRVVVAIDDAAAATAALDAAVQLACALDAQLMALFLENADLVRAADLPFLRETGAVTGMVRPMARAATLQMLHRHAEQARAAVAAAAEASGLRWRFEIVRGRRLAVSAAGEALDLLVLGQAAGRDMPDVLSALFPSAASAGDRPVAVTVHDVPGAERALQAAQALAASRDVPLLFLLCAHGAEHVCRLRELAHRALGGAPQRAEYIVLADWSPLAVVTAARQRHARLLVCCDGELRRDSRRLDALLAYLRCPVVVAE